MISRSILAIDDLMKPSASVKSSRELLVGAFEHGLGGIGGVFRDGRRRRTARGTSVAIRLKMSPRNSSSSLVKPMMFTSGERRSWLTM